MRGRRWILVVTASLGPLLLALVWFETQQAKAVHPAGSQPVGQPTMVLRNHTERIRTRSGQVAWQFRAERVDVLDGGDYLIYKLEQGQYLTHDEPEVDFSADLAHFEARTQNIALKGNVRVASRRGLTFSCESMLWFEADGKLVVPQADQLTMSDPQRPTEEPAAVETRRLFLWPRQQEIELPDPLIARQKTQTMQAESAHGWLTDGRFELRGPATVALLTALPAATGAPGQLDKRLILGVGAGGVMVGNGRSGGTMMRGHVALRNHGFPR